MADSSTFLTQTLAAHPYGQAAARILAAAIHAVEPGMAVRQFVCRDEQNLYVAGRAYPLERLERVRVLGLGKAATAMTEALVEILAGLDCQGLIISKHMGQQSLAGFEIQPGAHPVPDQTSLQAAHKAARLAGELQENDLLICLISGGGSALMTYPQAGLSLAEMQSLTATLLACGARIDEINTLRRHLDQLKGGGLAKLAAPAQVVSLILSDVVNSPLEAIASGPTAPDPSSRADALGVLEKYGVMDQVPPAVLAVLANIPETPKPGDLLFQRVQNVLVGSNQLAVQAALTQAQSEGMVARSLGSQWQGEARRVALELCQILKNEPERRPFCLIAGGETTVTLRGRGRGGRNQELALAAVQALDGVPGLLVTLATDGEDGPTDAAGAVVGGESLLRGQQIGLSPQPFLDDNDAYTYFSALGDLVRPGPTGTNVNDLVFLFGL